ncbi:MAG: caspase family protein, partial [Bacteroidota bacterium]
PNGKDQNLVCYQEDPTQQQLLLADKELAVLLYEVAAAHPNEPSSPHLIVSLDCCHSGSGTRDGLSEPHIKERTTIIKRPKSWEEAHKYNQLRPLASYLDGYFIGKDTTLPIAKHILLSACTSIQTAGDTTDGGIFTTSLLNTLKSGKGQLNYADVFVRTRAHVRNARKEQLPQFETIGGFDPHTKFLTGTPLGTPDQYELYYRDDTWFIKCGAIHGLPARPKNPIAVSIFSLTSTDNLLGNAHITLVGAQESSCQLNPDLQLDPQLNYQSSVCYLALPPTYVKLSGIPSAIQTLTASWEESKGLKWIHADKLESGSVPPFAVHATDDQYLINDEYNQRQVLSIPQQPNGARLTLHALNKMLRWERILALDNPKSSIRDRVQFSMDVLLNNHKKENYQNKSITLTHSSTDFLEKGGALFAGFMPQVEVTDTSQQLFFYLFHLRNNYSIECYEGETSFRPFEHPNKATVKIPLFKQPKGWGLSPDEKETFSFFKLIVTTEKLDYYQLLQSGLSGDRDTGWIWAPVGVSDEWFSATMKVTLRRD